MTAQPGGDEQKPLAGDREATRTFKVFVSSPGDVAEERDTARQVLEKLEQLNRDRLRIETYFWEDRGLSAAVSPQFSVHDPGDYDLVIVLLWARMGSPLPKSFGTRADGSCYLSGTDYEFQRAVDSHAQQGKPEVFVYRKTAKPEAPDTEDVTKFEEFVSQWKRVEEFFTTRFSDDESGGLRGMHYRFKDTATLRSLLNKHLEGHILSRLPDGRQSQLEGDPYVGLRPLDCGDEEIFFGRDADLAHVLEMTRRRMLSPRLPGFVLIYGMSGCGKSSLVRAGLLPKILGPDVIEGFEDWRYAVMTPSELGNDLQAGLRTKLTGPDVLPELQGAEKTTPGPEGPGFLSPDTIQAALHQAALKRQTENGLQRAPRTGLMIVIDQFEELFSIDGPDPKPGDKEEAQKQAHQYLEQFFQLLGQLCSGENKQVLVVSTLRADFIPTCGTYLTLMELKREGSYHLPPPSFSQIKQMIQEPARLAGLEFEVRNGISLADRIAEDAMENSDDRGILPLLAFTLRRLFEEDNGNRILEYKEYRDIGRVAGALAAHADAAYQELQEHHPEAIGAFEPAMRALASVSTDGGSQKITKRMVLRQRLNAIKGGRELVEFFEHEQRRLLVAGSLADPSGDSGQQPAVGLAHEALLRHWKQLTEWLENDIEFLRISGRLETAVENWVRHNRKRSNLWHDGTDYELAVDISRKFTSQIQESEETQKFIRASLREHRRRAHVKIAFLMLIAILAIVGWGQRQRAVFEADRSEEARQHAVEAEGHAKELASRSSVLLASVEQDPNRALTHLGRALRETPGNDVAASRLLSMLMYQNWVLPAAPPITAEEGTDPISLALYSPDGTRIAYSSGSTLHLRNLTTGEATSITADSAITMINFRPDGEFLAMGCFNGDARVLHLESGNSREISRHPQDQPAPIRILQWHPTLDRFLTADDQGLVLVWCREDPFPTYERTTRISPGRMEIKSASFSPDGDYILTAAGTQPQLWNAATGEEICDLESFQHQGPIESAQFSSSGKTFESGSDEISFQTFVSTAQDGEIKVWTFLKAYETAFPIRFETPLGSAQPTAVALSKQRSWLVIGFDTGQIWLWDLDGYLKHFNATLEAWDGDSGNVGWRQANEQVMPYAPLERYPDLHSGVVSASFDPTGTRLVVAGRNGELLVRYLDANVDPPRFQAGGDVKEVRFNPSGTEVLVLTGEGEVQQWRAVPSAALPTQLNHKSMVKNFSYCGISDHVLSVHGNQGTLWNRHEPRTRKATTPPSIDVTDAVLHCGLGASSGEYAQGRIISVSNRFTKRSLAMFDVDGTLIREAEPRPRNGVSLLALARNAPRLATGSYKELQIWSLDKQATIMTPLLPEGHQLAGPISLLRISPEGGNILTLTDGQLSFHHFEEGKGTAVELLLPQVQDVSDAAFSPDGTHVVACLGRGNSAVMWNIEKDSGTILKPTEGIRLPHLSSVTSVSFSAGGRYLATGSRDKTAKIWNVKTGNLVSNIEHPDGVAKVAFGEHGSGESRRLLTFTFDNVARLWDVDTGMSAVTPLHLGRGAKDPLLSKDGRAIIAAKNDQILIWDVPNPDHCRQEWIHCLVEYISGFRSDEDGNAPRQIDISTRLTLAENLFPEFDLPSAGPPASDQVVTVTRWFFERGETRAVSPFSETSLETHIEDQVSRFKNASQAGHEDTAREIIFHLFSQIGSGDPRLTELLEKVQEDDTAD